MFFINKYNILQVSIYRFILFNLILGYITIKSKNVRVEEGGTYELKCEAVHTDVKACAWITPSGKTYVLWDGANYERVEQKGNPEKQCGITVNKANAVDNGEWTCQITYIDQNGDGVAVSRSADVVVFPPSMNRISHHSSFQRQG